MRLYLSGSCVLRWLEHPSVYDISEDELFELDPEAFDLLRECSSAGGCRPVPGEFTDYCIQEGILVKERSGARMPEVLKSPEPSLRYLELQITRRCNLKCRHCYVGEPDGEELGVDAVARVLDEFERMQGLRVLITGGEPVLHSGFGRINDLLPGYRIRKVLLTNGTLLDGRRISGLNVDEVQVSVDGMRSAHDALRGRGSFDKAMGCITACLRAGLDVSVSTMVHAGNIGDFEAMKETFTGLGIKGWTVDVPCEEGRMRQNKDLTVPPEVAGKYLGYGYGGGLHGSAPGFACGAHLMSVNADGGCSKCAFYADRPLGRADEGLSACWSRARHLRLEELECDCELIDSCRGGCRFRAEVLGSSLGRDIYKCGQYGKM